MGTNRRHFSDEVKAKVVRRHLADKLPVSDLAAEHEIQPSLIHLWVKQVHQMCGRTSKPCQDDV